MKINYAKDGSEIDHYSSEDLKKAIDFNQWLYTHHEEFHSELIMQPEGRWVGGVFNYCVDHRLDLIGKWRLGVK